MFVLLEGQDQSCFYPFFEDSYGSAGARATQGGSRATLTPRLRVDMKVHDLVPFVCQWLRGAAKHL